MSSRVFIVEQLQELYYSRIQLKNFLPELINNCSDESLQDFLNFKIQITDKQKNKLQEIFDFFSIPIFNEESEITKALIKKARNIISRKEEIVVIDNSLLEVLEQISNYEQNACKATMEYASWFNNNDLSKLLGEFYEMQQLEQIRIREIKYQYSYNITDS